MGAGLLANAVIQSIYSVTDAQLSRASPLPHGFCSDCETSASLGGGTFVLDLGEVFLAQLRQILGAVAAAEVFQGTAHTVQLAVHRLQVIQQLTDGTRYRVRHVFADAIGIEADLLGHGLALGLLLITHFRLDDDPPRNTDNRCARRYSLGHHSIGADLGARTHGKRTEHLRARPDYNAIFQRRVALAFVPGCATQGHALVKGHVITNLEIVDLQKRVYSPDFACAPAPDLKEVRCYFQRADLVWDVDTVFDVRPMNCFGGKGEPISGGVYLESPGERDIRLEKEAKRKAAAKKGAR